jgi:cell shape-determining protein MreC
MAHNPSPSPTVPHHHHQHASSVTGASSPAPLSDAEAEAKRIRNTAASARFRRKKKAREASLERQGREKREALAKLENRITELEDENKFLKGLILWKKEGKEEDAHNGAEESIVVEPERKGRERKDGVGT